MEFYTFSSYFCRNGLPRKEKKDKTRRYDTQRYQTDENKRGSAKQKRPTVG